MKFEKLNLVKFDSVELNEESKTIVKGGTDTYMVSAKKDGDGTISDAGIKHDGNVN
ncbi:hypothetical protein [Lewinella cohaerens]|uniref:hypothetical protein n=1 Tax=Lewinella cohaerens TaxID=70995 RepID=UPI000379DAE3|nr:hypothetical protein [Lewinella cohaerens]